MGKRIRYRLGTDVADSEILRDRKGRIIDESYVETATQDALRKARARGRPSLSLRGESPLLRVRLPHDLDDAVRRAAERTGKSRAEWVRDALYEASRQAC